ncbi:hypothetical protein GV791_25325 [Nocardia cyriacigeorgica]|uniref:DUF6745 domain-containing protein n=1 Tax=Nocardia cyriacigeorgica TaxID=135487 RepID=A0A6P1CW40_9NOCA|nr:hypothetical protein [Nocardia cyriacigeorgica]MBF6426380.1 hypothetical protein [Nocardia cyriacigeorgica]NEW35863.1 hypothetical protein [Nocardia cyriacigeorgica]
MSVLGQREAANIRNKWLGRMLCTEPADRSAAEAAISEIYELVGLSPPRFRWASSPFIALTTGEPGGRGALAAELPLNKNPVARALASLHVDRSLDMQRSCRMFEPLVTWQLARTWTAVTQRILGAADRSLLSGRYRMETCWGSAWSDFPATEDDSVARLWELWADVTAACGPWWPGEHHCVVTERPQLLATEPAGDFGEVRLHRADGPAVRYGDGWELYFWHGTHVPAWVITDPTADAIDRENNAEVRRCAIESLGWPAYLEEAGTRLMAMAPDPGNHGFELMLYDAPRNQRVLVAVNGSVERDGTRRRYGLTVPGYFTDPVDAAAWTYGLTGAQYAQLLHRT